MRTMQETWIELCSNVPNRFPSSKLFVFKFAKKKVTKSPPPILCPYQKKVALVSKQCKKICVKKTQYAYYHQTPNWTWSNVLNRFPFSNFTCFQRNCVFASNSDFLIPISLQTHVVDLRYFEVYTLLVQIK